MLTSVDTGSSALYCIVHFWIDAKLQFAALNLHICNDHKVESDLTYNWVLADLTTSVCQFLLLS